MTPGRVHSSWPGPLYDIPINTLTRIVAFFREGNRDSDAGARRRSTGGCKKSLRETCEEQFKAIFILQLHRVVHGEIEPDDYFQHLDPKLKKAKGSLSIADFDCLISLLLLELKSRKTPKNKQFIVGLGLRIRGFLPPDSPVRKISLKSVRHKKQTRTAVNWKAYLQRFQCLLPNANNTLTAETIAEWSALKDEAAKALPPKLLKHVFFFLKKDLKRLDVQPEVASLLLPIDPSTNSKVLKIDCNALTSTP